MVGTVRLRPATRADERFVYETNNEVSARANAIDQTSIPWERHVAWFRHVLSDPGTVMWIVQDDGDAVGVVRFDLHKPAMGEASITIAISESARGRGVGALAIRESTRMIGMRDDVQRVVALVRPANTPSRRAFATAGFRDVGEAEVAGVRLQRYEHGEGAADR